MLAPFHYPSSSISTVPHRSGYIISGNVVFNGENPEDEFEVKKGGSYIFSANKMHGTSVIEETELIEAFTPTREEYKDF